VSVSSVGPVDPARPAASALAWALAAGFDVPGHLAEHYRPRDGQPDTASWCRILCEQPDPDYGLPDRLGPVGVHGMLLALAAERYDAATGAGA